jgi:RNA polymerase sigma-70 factor, ECF subfamily
LFYQDRSPEADRNMVTRCQKGDQLAFEELVRKYQQTVFNLVYHSMGSHMDVEDVAQKIFSKVYFSLPKFDSRRPFFPWLYRIAVNQCYDELRRLKRRRVLTFTDLSIEEAERIEKLVNDHGQAQVPQEDRQEIYDLLHRVMDQLPAQQKAALVLRDLESIPYEKMAELLNCTEQAARLKVFRARVRLRDLMEKALRRKRN